MMDLKAIKIAGFGLLSICLLSGCDPLRVFTIQTQKDSSVIKVYFKESAQKSTAFELTSNPLEVSTSTGNEFSAFFSIGYWNDEDIQYRLTQHIDSIIIQTKDTNEFYKSPESIQQFLKKNHKFFSKNVIEIKR